MLLPPPGSSSPTELKFSFTELFTFFPYNAGLLNTVSMLNFTLNNSDDSFHWHVQNVTIPCRSQELLPIPLCYVLFSATLLHQLFFYPVSLILPSISWSPTQSSCSQIHIYNTPLGILFSSILSTCPNQHNLFNFIVSTILIMVFYN